MCNGRNIQNADNTVQILVVYQYLCEPFFNSSIAYCGSGKKKYLYACVCVHGTCVVEHFVGDLCSRFKPLSTLHPSVLLSLSVSLSISLALTPSFSLSGAIDTHLTASEAPFLI